MNNSASKRTIKLDVCLPVEVREAIRRAADERGCSMAHVVVEAMRTALLPAGAADRAAEALASVYQWCAANRKKFVSRGDSDPAPAGGWFGRWSEGDDWIAIVPAHLRGHLAANGYDEESIVEEWADRGWLRLQEGNHGRHYPARLGFGRFAPVMRCVYVRAPRASAEVAP